MTMIALEQARQHLETLGLKQAVEVLDNTLDAAANKQLTYADVLAQLLGAEVAARRERYLTTKTRMAHLPFQRTLEQFDFGFQPSIDERQVKELANLAFVSEATNILLLGPPIVVLRTLPTMAGNPAAGVASGGAGMTSRTGSATMVLQRPDFCQLEEPGRSPGHQGHHLLPAGPLHLAGLAGAGLGVVAEVAGVVGHGGLLDPLFRGLETHSTRAR